MMELYFKIKMVATNQIFEVMPGIIPKAISGKSKISPPIIAGGMITEKGCNPGLKAGAIAVSTSKREL